jgi:hypothetical protein
VEIKGGKIEVAYKNANQGGDTPGWRTVDFAPHNDALSNLRLPDYLSVDVSVGIPQTAGLIGVNFVASVDRYGKGYISLPGISVAKSLTTLVSVSVTANWITTPNNSIPTKSQLFGFLTGNSTSIGGGYGDAAFITMSPSSPLGTAYGYGYSTPQGGGSWNYTPEWATFQTNFKY